MATLVSTKKNTEESLKQLYQLGFNIPPIFMEFLLNHNGGELDVNTIDLVEFNTSGVGGWDFEEYKFDLLEVLTLDKIINIVTTEKLDFWGKEFSYVEAKLIPIILLKAEEAAEDRSIHKICVYMGAGSDQPETVYMLWGSSLIFLAVDIHEFLSFL